MKLNEIKLASQMSFVVEVILIDDIQHVYILRTPNGQVIKTGSTPQVVYDFLCELDLHPDKGQE